MSLAVSFSDQSRMEAEVQYVLAGQFVYCLFAVSWQTSLQYQLLSFHLGKLVIRLFNAKCTYTLGFTEEEL